MMLENRELTSYKSLRPNILIHIGLHISKSLIFAIIQIYVAMVKITPWTNANGTQNGWYVVEQRLRTSFVTLDGVTVVSLFSTWADDDGGKGEKKKNVFEIIVDINGREKPNRLGRDVFYLTRVTENGGGIRPYGFEKSNDEINQNCSKTGRGEYCAEKIRRAGWKIDKSYPWK